jgi:hypothetical protein
LSREGFPPCVEYLYSNPFPSPPVGQAYLVDALGFGLVVGDCLDEILDHQLLAGVALRNLATFLISIQLRLGTEGV